MTEAEAALVELAWHVKYTQALQVLQERFNSPSNAFEKLGGGKSLGRSAILKGFKDHLGIPPIQGLACFRVLDADRDGLITKKEWLRAYETLSQKLLDYNLKARFKSGLISFQPSNIDSPASRDDSTSEVCNDLDPSLTQSVPSSPRRSEAFMFRSLEKLIPVSSSDDSAEAPKASTQEHDFQDCISLMPEVKSK